MWQLMLLIVGHACSWRPEYRLPRFFRVTNANKVAPETAETAETTETAWPKKMQTSFEERHSHKSDGMRGVVARCVSAASASHLLQAC